MDIGIKIKNARTECKMTQESAAELLGVSRQTVSNWENGKTYPDILSVIKMSDIYNVSLDRLLKEENYMCETTDRDGYMDFLDESTNTVKSKMKFSKLLIVSSYLVIWAFALLFFWFFRGREDAAAYSILVLWIILPMTTFVQSLVIGVNGYWEKYKVTVSVVYGILYMLAEYGTFQLANMTAFGKVNVPSFEMIFIGAVISLVGISIGHTVKKHKSKKRTCDK